MTRKPLNRGKLTGIKDALDSTPMWVPEKPAQKIINMNFKAPESHRRWWKAEAAKRGEDISKVLRDYLAQRYGLPDGGE